jgi:uncharacterized membrane protein YozB (DUF420 family)
MPMSLADLPRLNACLNSLSALLLVWGWANIRMQRVAAHRACMVGALVTSSLFLVSYLTYHAQVGTVRFPGHGALRTIYLAILTTHTILAAVIVPLVVLTLRRALRREFPRHARLARWTMPLWLYVSVTGVVVYWLLYQVAGAVPG